MRRRQFGVLSVAGAAGQGLAGLRWKVFAPEHYAPFSSREGGVAQGLLVDRLRLGAQRSGLAYELELTAWARALALAERGEGGLLGVSRTPEREVWLDFSQAVAHDELMLWVRSGQGFAFTGLQDLRGRQLGMARRTTGGPDFDAMVSRGELQVLRDDVATKRLLALRAGRIEAAVLGGGRAGLRRVVAGLPELKEADFEALPHTLLRDALHLAFPKRMNARSELARFDAALEAAQPK